MQKSMYYKKNIRGKTTFYTVNRKMQFRIMPQKINNAQLLKRILSALIKKKLNAEVLCNIDGVLIYGKSIWELHERLCYVLCIYNGYSLNKYNKKCRDCTWSEIFMLWALLQ